MLDKKEFERLKMKYNNQEMITCYNLYKYYKSNGIFDKLEIDPLLLKYADTYFTHVFESKLGSIDEILGVMIADEYNPDAFIIRKEVSDVIRHVETYLKMCPY